MKNLTVIKRTAIPLLACTMAATSCTDHEVPEIPEDPGTSSEVVRSWLTMLLLTLFLSLLLTRGIAQESIHLAHVSPSRVASAWTSTTDYESVSTVSNPLTRHLSVMPRITVNDDGNVFVYIFNPKHVDIKVRLQDQAGHALHRDNTATLYYGKLLNVSELSAGNYALTLLSDTISVKYIVKIGPEGREIKVKEAAGF